ncbi:SubName: Full=Uncharacterized protein {ECO:0000313/EMBL:CCA68186.1} [Serendipita indica DSM 11827]|uniref:BTB domain-containing protein n=1 Tax=Serendipita indica (strain DSM 11827) TaxID=1109443 RepID=G4TA28_SERID|nr:SubName: Full=Uncharacterized protein {ECO:0000313/EMBL:CCA68186.1} [Serendipita indica DSM 11827]CCA68186.1 hypothetical protein PIIN_02052 [Serendipita indica DSM 11827]
MKSRHPVWYFEDGNCIFLVDNVLFNLHRFVLTRNSAVFGALFQLPPPQRLRVHAKRAQLGEESVPEGVDDTRPIVLNGVSLVDFEAFLSLLYLPIYESDEHFSLAQWISILEVATRWDFTAIRQHAVTRLEGFAQEDMTPVLRISLARRYHLRGPSWQLRPLTALVTRKEYLSIEEAQLVGLETAILIARAREEVRNVIEVEEDFCDCCERCGKTSLLEENDVEDVIADILGLGSSMDCYSRD